MSEGKGILNFKKDANHFTSLVNGAYGGVVGDGMSDLIEVHFFCETNPEIERIEIDLATGKELGRFPTDVSKERVVKFTGLLTIKTAQSIGEWLLKNVAEAHRAHGEKARAADAEKVH